MDEGVQDEGEDEGEGEARHEGKGGEGWPYIVHSCNS